VALIGAGRLGASLALGLAAAGYDLVAIGGRGSPATLEFARRLGVNAVSPSEAALSADLFFLAVPDIEIGPLAASVPWRAGQRVVHCSGASGLDVLAPVTQAGGLAGCLHPLQSFSRADGEPERFRGVTCGVEGEEPLGRELEQMAADLGGHAIRLEGVDRALYHAAAVFSSNYVVALMAAATRAWEAAGLPPGAARSALAPLLLGAAGNIERRELHEALTGPVARGDIGTVERHLAALEDERELAALYRRLGALLLDLPLSLDGDTRERLRALLSREAAL
jgi:predicted short-subunit dehydrogenase-like oxidoreductase (DUF2520 family)